MCALRLTEVVEALESIAPLSAAANWDNVGLLVEPAAVHEVQNTLLCIDLTEPVMSEALRLGVDLIVAYHPPIFGGLKRLTQSRGLERSLIQAVAKGVAIYSPHTALDAAQGGVCDWLADGLGARSASSPIEPNPLEPALGLGRMVTLSSEVNLASVIDRLKDYLGLRHVRLALPDGVEASEYGVREVALCPGAGGSLFENLNAADLFLTGEMGHHDVLGRVAQGAAVILTEHSNSERGYLPLYRERILEQLSGALDVHLSKADLDPLSVA